MAFRVIKRYVDVIDDDGNVAIGSCCATEPSSTPHPHGATAWTLAALVGALHWFAMAVDFPTSNRRFARLV